MSSHYLRLHLEPSQNKNNSKLLKLFLKTIKLFLKKPFKIKTKIKILLQNHLKSKIILNKKPD